MLSNNILFKSLFWTGVLVLTAKLFDLDGAQAGSSWAPPKGILYKNQQPRGPANPYFLKGRWGNVQKLTIRHSWNVTASHRYDQVIEAMCRTFRHRGFGDRRVFLPRKRVRTA